MKHEILCKAVEALGALIAVLKSEPDATSEGWIDQQTSPLGPRRHCALARKLIAAGDRRAMKAGRRYLVRADALNEPVKGKRVVRAEPQQQESAAARAARRLQGAA